MKFRPIRLSLVVWIGCILTSDAHAQLKLDRFFPPVVAAGVETVVTAEGKFPNWPPKHFCDRDDIAITLGEKSGKVTMNVAEDSPPGVAWIRLYDDKTASDLVPMVVSNVAVTVESEPNDKRSDANPLSLPAVVAGRLAKAGDSDAYRISVKAGERLIVSVTANQVLKSPMDAVLQLTDLRGNVLFQSDDARGLDPQIVFVADSDEELLIRIFACPETPTGTVGFAGSAAFVYTIDVTTGPYADHFAATRENVFAYGHNLPSKPVINQSDATDISPRVASLDEGLGWSWIASPQAGGNTILHRDEYDGSLPIVILGHITERKETHSFRFTASKGTKYRAEVRSKPDGFLIDSKLDFIDAKSTKVLATNDDVSRGRYDAGVDFTAKEGGDIEVHLSDMLDSFGPRHFYQLSIRQVEPAFRISVASEHFAIVDGKELEIPVSISRDSGLLGQIQVSAVGLPGRISAEPVISESKGVTAKAVKLKLVPAKEGDEHGSAERTSFRIVGTLLDEEGKTTQQSEDASYDLRPAISLSQFWLSLPSPVANKAIASQATDKAKP